MARPGDSEPRHSSDLSRPQHYGRPIPLARLAACNAVPAALSKAGPSKFTASKAARLALTQTAAISIWLKKSAATAGNLWASYRASSDDGYFAIRSNADGAFLVSGWTTSYKQTTGTWALGSGWTHLVVIVDLAAATAAARLALYVNGVRLTAFDTDTGPATLDDDWLNLITDFYVGDTAAVADPALQFDGELAECAFWDDCPRNIDASYFGQRDGSLWVPRRPFIPGGDRRGFYLPLENGSGADASGNGNSLTPSAVTAGALQRIASVYGA